MPSQAESKAVSSHSRQDQVPDQSHVRLPPYIRHISECRLLICRVHDVCLTRKSLLEHLEQEHDMSAENSSQAYQAALEFDVAPNRTGIRIPAPDAPPIPGLQWLLGFQCTVTECCPFLSPYRESLENHFAKHGGRRKYSSHYRKVAMQNFFPGKRPFYFVVNTSANTGESSTSSAAAEVGMTTIKGSIDREDGIIQEDEGASEGASPFQEFADGSNSSETGKDADMGDRLIQEDIRASFTKEYANGQNTASARLGRGLRPSLDPAPPTSSSLSSATNLPLAAVNSQSTSQLALASTPTLLVTENTIFLTKRQDTGKIHICLAKDITSPDSQAAVFDPSCVDFGSYCDLLAGAGILDQEANIGLGFQPIGGERIPISNQMMFRAAVTYQVDRKFDMVTFSAAVAVPT